jgi:uncharacterized SAM-binding protein YcdF (DUF218 family)
VPVADDEVRWLARRLWDFQTLQMPLPRRVDVVIAAGCHDERVAERAAELMRNDLAPMLVTTGGYGKVTGRRWKEPEAQRFANVAVAHGCARERILIEPRAQNTGENITLSRAVLEQAGVRCEEALLVAKPYVQRRILAAAQKQWSRVRWHVTAPAIDFDRYPTVDAPEDLMISLMVGDLERLRVYAERGWQVAQEIPADVWHAYERLVSRGFDDFCVTSTSRTGRNTGADLGLGMV